MTNLFQPLDISVNKAAKSAIRKYYREYYREQVTQQLNLGTQPHYVIVDLKLSTIKPLHAQWLINVYNRFQTDKSRDIIVNGFRRSGITEAINYKTFSEQDPFKS